MRWRTAEVQEWCQGRPPAPAPGEEAPVTAKAVARLSGCPVRTVLDWRKRGKPPTAGRDGRSWLFKKADVLALAGAAG